MDQLEFSFSEEIWKPIVGYEGFYEVSNKGRVRSLKRKVSNGHGFYIKEGRVLAMSKTTTGYWKVELKKSGEKRRSMKVHRLVAFAFIPNPENKPNINHIDGNPLNNEVENLEWCTQKENLLHATRNGLIKMVDNFTENRYEILREYTIDKKSAFDLSKKYKCSQASIKKFLIENGVEVRGVREAKNKYNINKEQLLEDIKSGMKNKDVAKKHNIKPELVASYKYLSKKEKKI